MYSAEFPCSLGIINSKKVFEVILSMILFIRIQGNIDPVYVTPVRFSPENYDTFAELNSDFIVWFTATPLIFACH